MDKTDAPTLFNIGTTAGVKEWGSSAMDLSGTDIEKALSTTDYTYKDSDGRLVCAGLCYETYGIVVNADLVEKAGHSVDDIKDFDSLKTVVEDIHKNAATLGFDAFAATDLDDSSSWRVTGHLANLEYYYEEKDDGGWDATPPSRAPTSPTTRRSSTWPSTTPPRIPRPSPPAATILRPSSPPARPHSSSPALGTTPPSRLPRRTPR